MCRWHEERSMSPRTPAQHVGQRVTTLPARDTASLASGQRTAVTVASTPQVTPSSSTQPPCSDPRNQPPCPMLSCHLRHRALQRTAASSTKPRRATSSASSSAISHIRYLDIEHAARVGRQHSFGHWPPSNRDTLHDRAAAARCRRCRRARPPARCGLRTDERMNQRALPT